MQATQVAHFYKYSPWLHYTTVEHILVVHLHLLFYTKQLESN